MPDTTVNDFLKELDEIIGDKTSMDDRKNCTRELIKAADALYDSNAIIKQRQLDGTFRTNICGDTRIEERPGDKTYDRPVVDLVQQGGTMLGIGLLGYTYIMEKAGLRFRSMAGTSAGAINTLLLAAIPASIYREQSIFDPTRNAVKSEMLAYLVANSDFSKFLDRRGFLGRLQLRLVKKIKTISKIMPVIKILAVLLLVGVSYGMYHLLDKWLFNTNNNLSESAINNYNFIMGTLGILAVLLLVLILIFNLFKNKMGFNPGDYPYDWMKSILETEYVNTHTTKKLMDAKANEKKPISGDVELKSDPRLVFITANLTHNRIVKFPENRKDYWNQLYADEVSPAAYVRASMSLPFIFYSFIPGDNHVQMPDAKQTVNMLARFVDGGMLSNFPIREFHVPPPASPSYPTFGVLLGSPKPEPGQDSDSIRKKFWSLSVFKYILSFISTFRNFYDSDFLRTHPEFKMLVKAVDTDQFNSLDFGMDFPTKQALFVEGAKTAIEQLQEFSWTDYLKVRMGTEPEKSNQLP